MKNHVYKGVRLPNDGGVEVTADGQPLDPRNDIRNHSPDGFEWGYSGSGPAQLALAILMHHFGGDAAMATQFYQDFKRKVIATIPPTGDWKFGSALVEAALEEIARDWKLEVCDE